MSSETVYKSNALVIERVFDAPLELAWKAWSDPDKIKQWWGPKNFTAPEIKIDFRIGGKYLYCMRGVPGPGLPVQDFWNTGVFKEIVPLKLIVSTDSFADEQGNKVPASHYNMPGDNWPLIMLLTVKFEEIEKNKTKLTISHLGHPAGTITDMARQGWNESLDKMEEVLKRVS